MNRDEIMQLRPRELRELLSGGHPIELSALDDTEYRGIALGLPKWFEKLAWQTFRKVFHRDQATGHLRGWNVRIVQEGLDSAWRPMQRDGKPLTFGHYRVTTTAGRDVPAGCEQGLLIDYGLGGNAALDPMRAVRDPLVALDPGSSERLLGWSYVQFGRWHIPTPSFFLLERDRPLSHVHRPPT